MWPMAFIDALLTPRRWAPAPLQGLATRMSAALTRDSLPIARWLGACSAGRPLCGRRFCATAGTAARGLVRPAARVGGGLVLHRRQPAVAAAHAGAGRQTSGSAAPGAGDLSRLSEPDAGGAVRHAARRDVAAGRDDRAGAARPAGSLSGRSARISPRPRPIPPSAWRRPIRGCSGWCARRRPGIPNSRRRSGAGDAARRARRRRAVRQAGGATQATAIT